MASPATSTQSSSALVSPTPATKHVKKEKHRESTTTLNLRGHVVHQGDQTPVSNYVVKIFRENLLLDTHLATKKTHSDGSFKAKIPNNVSEVHLQFGFIPHESITEKTPHGEFRVMHDQKFKLKPGKNTDIGNIAVNHWEYFQDPKLPFLKMPGLNVLHPKQRMEVPSIAYLASFAIGVAKPAASEAAFKLCGYSSTIDEIQKVFGKNDTIAFEEVVPGSTRSPSYMGHMLMSGSNPSFFKKGNKEGLYEVEFNWDAYEWDNQGYQLPNTKIVCRMSDKGNLIPIQVSLQFRKLTKDGKPLQGPGKNEELRKQILLPWEVYDETHPKFKAALRYARTSDIAEGQIAHHLGTHMLVDMHNQAIKRNLHHDSFLRRILDPHLRGTPTINDLGNGLIFGDSGVLSTATALTANSVNQRFSDIIGSKDWADWRPRKPLSSQDTFAQTANIIWDAIQSFAKEAVNSEWAQIQKEGKQIFKFSEELVKNSFPFKPRDGVARDQWVDLGEIDNSERPRVTVNNELKATRPIVSGEKLTDSDKENIIQYIAYLIYHATFLHSWTHDLKADVGEIKFASLGICGETVKEENDPTSYPHPRDAVTQLKLAFALPDLKYGYVIKNEENDMHPLLIQKLKEREKELDALNFPLSKLRSSINS